MPCSERGNWRDTRRSQVCKWNLHASRTTARRRRSGLKIVDITEFYSERGGGVRSHLTTRGHVLCQRGHDHAVIAPGPRDDVVVLNASAAPARSECTTDSFRHAGRTRVVRIGGPALPYDRTYHLL